MRGRWWKDILARARGCSLRDDTDSDQSGGKVTLGE